MKASGETVSNEIVERDGYHLARYEFACRYVRDKEVLDVATGIGYGAEMLSRLGKAISVNGVDCSEEAIAYASSHYAAPGVAYDVGDAMSLEFEDEGFDVVVSLETIEHIVDYHGFLDEIARVLRQDGALLMSTPNKRYDSRNELHVSPLTVDEFRELLLSRFESVETFGQDLMSFSARLIARANRFAGLFVPGPLLVALSRVKRRLAADARPEISPSAELSGYRHAIAVCSGPKHGGHDVE